MTVKELVSLQNMRRLGLTYRASTYRSKEARASVLKLFKMLRELL